MESERGVSGAMVYILEGLIKLGADAVAVAVVVAHASAIILRVICS